MKILPHTAPLQILQTIPLSLSHFSQSPQSCRSVCLQTLWWPCQRVAETWGSSFWRWSLPAEDSSRVCCCTLRARKPSMTLPVEQQWQVRRMQELISTALSIYRWFKIFLFFVLLSLPNHGPGGAGGRLPWVCEGELLLLSYTVSFWRDSACLKRSCMWYLYIVNTLAIVDGHRHITRLEKQQESCWRKLSNALLWTGSAAKHILAT